MYTVLVCTCCNKKKGHFSGVPFDLVDFPVVSLYNTYTRKGDVLTALTNLELFEENKNIVYYCYNQFRMTSFILNAKEEIIQEGFLALWQAILSYDSNKGEKISSYLFPCVKNAMLSYIRDNARDVANTISLNTPVTSESDECELTIEDMLYEDFNTSSDTTFIEEVIETYMKYVNKNHKSKRAIDLRIHRAKIILYELLSTGKIDACKIQSKYSINRTIVGKIVNEIRTMLQEEFPTSFKNRRRHRIND